MQSCTSKLMYVYFFLYENTPFVKKGIMNEKKIECLKKKRRWRRVNQPHWMNVSFFPLKIFQVVLIVFFGGGGGNGEAVYCCVEWSVMCVFGGGVHFKQFGWMGSLGLFLLLEWNRIKRTSVCIFMRVFCFPWEKIRHNVNCLLCILIIILGKRW